jgi:exosome complex RNA-binding protein Rrp4
VDTDSALSIRTLALGRRRFFPEGDAVGEALVNEYIRHRKEMIERKKERNRLLKNGAMFFVATFLVDFYISML